MDERLSAAAVSATEAGEEAGAGQTIRVWDPFVRLFHWTLVAGIAAEWITSDGWGKVHEWIGYGIIALVTARIAWGFIGSHHARFANFLRGPVETLGYLRRILQGQAERHIGHNPAGAAMIVALLASIALVCLTGWMMTTDAYFGVDWVEQVHEAGAWGMLVLVALHVAGVVHASLHHRENLVKAMFTGRKRP